MRGRTFDSLCQPPHINPEERQLTATYCCLLICLAFPEEEEKLPTLNVIIYVHLARLESCKKERKKSWLLGTVELELVQFVQFQLEAEMFQSPLARSEQGNYCTNTSLKTYQVCAYHTNLVQRGGCQNSLARNTQASSISPPSNDDVFGQCWNGSEPVAISPAQQYVLLSVRPGRASIPYILDKRLVSTHFKYKPQKLKWRTRTKKRNKNRRKRKKSRRKEK